MGVPKKYSIYDRFLKHAVDKSQATRVYRCLVAETLPHKDELDTDDILHLTLFNLLNTPGIGRKGALLVIEVAADLNGEK